MSWLLTNFIAAFLLPPLSLLLLFLSGLLLWHKRPRVAHTLLVITFILFWLLSTPILSSSLLKTLESPALKFTAANTPVDAIVVLGGGTYLNAPEYDGDTVSATSLERVRYAAKLYHLTRKPILLTGGMPLGNNTSEASLMQQVLEQEFNSPVKWIEEESNNTLESARNSYSLLQQSGIKRIYLVTHAWHMPRAIRVFTKAGFEVIAAPTGFDSSLRVNLLSFLPSAGALADSQIFLHEWIGLLWYQLKS